MSILGCRQASFGYDGRVVVSDVHFEVHEGDYLCIVGENGSGKSTLVRGLLGLIRPMSGEVVRSRELLKSGIGYLPQQSAAQADFPASVREVVLSGRIGSVHARGFLPFFGVADRDAADDSMRLLEIEELEARKFSELSGGQRQRVLLARALCAGRSILILDEPVAGLDPLVTRDFYEAVERINRQSGVAVVMVSHDVETALGYASHILHIRGSQEFFGTGEEYLKTEACRCFVHRSDRS